FYSDQTTQGPEWQFYLVLSCLGTISETAAAGGTSSHSSLVGGEDEEHTIVLRFPSHCVTPTVDDAYLVPQNWWKDVLVLKKTQSHLNRTGSRMSSSVGKTP
ncbi:hypothetical protein AMECASPLE_014386, partial [Ameca splendens]